jgi:hypothetical protein
VSTIVARVPGRDGGVADSIQIVLLERDGTRGNVIAAGRGEEAIEVRASAGGESMTMYPVFGAADQAVALSDGRIVVARPEPYRVEVFDSSGARIALHSLAWSRRPVTARVRSDFLDDMRDRLGSRVVLPPGMPWAKYVPPFGIERSLIASPDDHVLIEKTHWKASEPRYYDVLDREGAHEFTLKVRPRQRIVGLGRGTAFVVEVDDDGVQRLAVYDFPPSR